MDYTTQPLSFKLKKALRYVHLYGPTRTLVKIKGQYHMKRQYACLPTIPKREFAGGHVGIIGCGNFAFSNIAYYLFKNHKAAMLAAMDIDLHRAASLFQSYKLQYYTDNAERIISDPQIQLIYIASNHASHAEYAVASLHAGKSVHIEKPHVVSEDQLVRLCRTMAASTGKVALGFNRPKSMIGQRIRQALDRQSGPAMFNWFIAGHEIAPDHWYFKDTEGGRVLGNLCHWTDFVYQMVPAENRFPITITPTRAKKSDCDIAVTFTFGDGSIAAITFSAKGHTFEGVRERFAAHRGNVLISMDDFKHLVIEDVEKKTVVSPFFRDHGHERNILNSYQMAQGNGDQHPGCSISYVWETGQLFLKTREALENQKQIEVSAFPGSI